MSIYKYSALSHGGAKINGALMADDYKSVYNMLRTKKYHPLVIEKARLSEKKVALEDMLMFFFHVDMQLKCRIRIDKALASFLELHGNKALKASLANILNSLKNGSSLGIAFEKCVGIFDKTVITLLKSAEQTGNLSEIIKNILKYLKLQSNWKNHIKRALMYPIFLLLLATLILVFSIYLLAPLVVSLLRDYGQNDIPFMTTFVIDILPKLSEILVFSLVLLLAASTPLLLSRNGREKMKGYLLKIPKIGDIATKISLWQFCKILHIALDAKLAFMEALDLAIASAQFQSIREELQLAKQYLANGYSVGESFSRIKLVSGEVLSALLVGEESGNLSASFCHVSDAQYDEIFFAIKSLGQQLSIGLTLFTGVILAIILSGLLLPIYGYVEGAGA
ncbi:MAG: type II secretion system F family protein [Holosporaceae bacterium]|jgi:type II secretory pathway component PulF|nr:type II secretion system F family protein [Holosporaceae bacterium]